MRAILCLFILVMAFESAKAADPDYLVCRGERIDFRRSQVKHRGLLDTPKQGLKMSDLLLSTHTVVLDQKVLKSVNQTIWAELFGDSGKIYYLKEISDKEIKFQEGDGADGSMIYQVTVTLIHMENQNDVEVSELATEKVNCLKAWSDQEDLSEI